MHWNCRTMSGRHHWAKKNIIKKIGPLFGTLNQTNKELKGLPKYAVFSALAIKCNAEGKQKKRKQQKINSTVIIKK